jgi:prepilin-type N-terminal cleavage/methylation domain-containing protein
MKQQTSHSFSSVKKSSRAGFSLIEVLVSVTILVVVVLIVGMIFQQTSTAWTIGISRSRSQSANRAIVSAIANDLKMAIDPTHAQIVEPGTTNATSNDASFNDEVLQISGSTLSFYVENDGADPLQTKPVRGISRIEYSAGSGRVTRSETPIGWNGSNAGSRSTAETRLDRNASLQFSKVSNFENAVKIKIDTGSVKKIDDYEIAVGSAGPDGEWGTDDDIKSWPDGEDR